MHVVSRWLQSRASVFCCYVGLAVIIGVLVALKNMSDPWLSTVITSSDQLTIPSLAEDYIHNPNFAWSTWSIPRAPYLFPDFILVYIFYMIFDDAYIVTALYFIIHNVLLCFCAIAIMHNVYLQRWCRFTAIFIVCCSIILYGMLFSSGLTAWPFLSISHATSIFTAVLTFLLIESVLKADKPDKTLVFLFVILSFASMLSDKIYFIFFSMPYCLLLGAMSRTTRSVVVAAGVVLSQFVCLALIEVIRQKLHFQIMEDQSVSNIPAHIRNFLQAVLVEPLSIRAFYLGGFVSLILFGGWGFLKRDRTIMFLSLSAVSNFALCIYLWSTPDGGPARYQVMLFFVFVISFSWCITKVIAIGLRPRKSVVASFLAMIACVAYSVPSIGRPFDLVRAGRATASELRTCVARFNLHSGFAAYWIARKISASTNWNVEVDQFEPNQPRAFFWGSNLGWFVKNIRDGKAKIHDFIIENDIERSSILEYLGQPTREVECGPWRIALFSNSSAVNQKILDRLLDELPLGLKKDFVEAGYELPTEPFKISVVSGSMNGVEGQGEWINSPDAEISIQNLQNRAATVIWKATFAPPPCVDHKAVVVIDSGAETRTLEIAAATDAEFSVAIKPLQEAKVSMRTISPVCKILNKDPRPFYFSISNLHVDEKKATPN